MEPDSISYIEIISELGATGMLGWILFQVFRRTLPDMQKDFKEVIAMQQEAIDKQREDFLASLVKIEENMDRISKRMERLTIAVAKLSDDDIL